MAVTNLSIKLIFWTVIGLLYASSAFPFTGQCVGIADGDTITVMNGRRGEVIRLYGTDTPERGQDFGTKAKKYLSDLVYRKVVEVQPQDTDRYGRTVGLVLVGGIDVSRELVKAGYAWVYRKYCLLPFCSGWLDLENQARANGIGLWSHANPVPPWEFKRGLAKQKSAAPVGLAESQTRSMVFHCHLRSRMDPPWLKKWTHPGCRGQLYNPLKYRNKAG